MDYSLSNVNDYAYFQFVDRKTSCPPQPPGERPFGYGMYRVTVNGHSIFVDFRDADYGTLSGYHGLQDLKVWYTIGDNSFTDDWGRHIAETYGVWEQVPPKSTPIQIPITITDNMNGAFGGSVKVNGIPHRYPYRTCFDRDAIITVEAAATQQPNWIFDSWSDGGARMHAVTTDIDKFAYILTARYIQDPRLHGAPLSAAAHPNPFNPTTKISYTISERQLVKVTIIDNLGRLVQVLDDGVWGPGTRELTFDGANLPSGTYFYQVRIGGSSLTRPLLLLK